jgi:superfamily II DNA or RNA helicase
MVRVEETASNLYLTGDPKELNFLARAFRYHPEGFQFSPRYELYKKTDGEKGWDGFLYPLKIRGTSGKMGRGYLSRLRFQAEVLGVRLEEKTIKSPFTLTVDDIVTDGMKLEFDLYPHQREAVQLWLENAIGQCEITVSGGKTASFCVAARMVKRRFPNARVLYLVPTERLINQVFAEATRWMADWDITQFGGGKRNFDGKDMVVATYAAVHRNFKKLVADGWLKSFMVLMVDESHHAGSDSLSRIIETSPAYFKFGATDNVGDTAEKRIVNEGLLGPVLMSMDATPLIEEGHLAKPTIYVVSVDEWKNKFADVPELPPSESPAWVYSSDGKWLKGTYMGPAVLRDENGNIKYDKRGEELHDVGRHTIVIDEVEREVNSRWCLLERPYDRGIIRFSERNKLVVDWATYFAVEKNYQTLVVCTRTLHAAILESLIATELEKAGRADKTRLLYSVHSTKERNEVFEWFKKTAGAVLVTPLVKEGVSLPEIRAGVVADYVSSEGLANQIIGRFIRKKKTGDNEAHIVWFHDVQVPSFRRNSARLIKMLRLKEGYKFVEPVVGPRTSILFNP